MAQLDFVVRSCDLARDREAITSLDTSYTTPGCFEAVRKDERLTLQIRPGCEPLHKRFPIRLDSDPGTRGWVAESQSKIIGFIGTQFHSWNRRLAIWHFYVRPSARRQGVGRELLQRALEFGRTQGAITCWTETSNYNLPGIAAYERLGFQRCGFDLSLYCGTPSAGEFAIYLARPIE